MTGKEKCRLLRDIRRKAAEENGIPYDFPECDHQGECTGSCPACESEAEYIANELERLKDEGNDVRIEGIYTLPPQTEADPISFQKEHRTMGISAAPTPIPKKKKKKKGLFSLFKKKRPKTYQLMGDVPYMEPPTESIDASVMGKYTLDRKEEDK